MTLLLAAIVVLTAAGGAALLIIVRKRRRAPGDELDNPGGTEPPPTKQPGPGLDPPARGVLRIAGPGAIARQVPLGPQPITVGRAPGSDIVLQEGPEVAASHLRLWWRDGRLMLHHLDHSTQTLVNGRAAEWVALEPGDEIRVGSYQLRYLLPGTPADEGPQ